MMFKIPKEEYLGFISGKKIKRIEIELNYTI